MVNQMGIRLFLSLAVLFELPTECIDFTPAFPRATLDVDIYMNTPQGFTTPTGNNGEQVLKLIKPLYGLKSASKIWFDLLSASLRKKRRDFELSAVDPCVFFRNEIIVFVYVDDWCIIGKYRAVIDEFVKFMKNGEDRF